MKRKIIPLVFAVTLSAALLAGCGPVVSKDHTEEASQEQTEYVSSEETQSEEKSEGDTEVKNEPATESEADAASASPEVEPVEATLEKPAKFGEWVETKKYSGQDSKYHTIYYKITGVIRGEEAKKIVDAYNAEGHMFSFKELEQEDLEYGIVTYETYFPKDFPQGDYGITEVSADLSLCNLEDSGLIANYVGLSSVWDISDTPSSNEFYAGDTFKDGRAVFAMVKGFTEYLFNGSYNENDTEVNTYVMGQ